METYGRILLVAMPVFLALVLFEKWYGWYKGADTVRNMDMISSLSSGITNVTKDVLGLSVALVSYEWMVNKLAFFHPGWGVWLYFVAFLALDFAGYWVHRIAHQYNFFWNSHIVHHSSEEFNLACALRQSISVFLRLFTFFLLPAALLGVPAKVIAITAPLHLFAQFWYHTRHINKMGWLEYLIVTPSHHRVHHAINPEYIDKNYGQIFIFWDKLFGSFQPELPHVQPVYGITRPVATWNPIKINFQHLWLLMKDAWRTQRWQDKCRIWWMPTGWRPDDLVEQYPVYKIEDVYQFNKYEGNRALLLQAWSWFQLLITLLLVSYLFGNLAYINQLNATYIYLYGLFIFLQVYAFTDLMDGNKYAWIPESIKCMFGGWLLITQNNWFGAASLFSAAPAVYGAYLVLSFIVTMGWVIRFHRSVHIA